MTATATRLAGPGAPDWPGDPELAAAYAHCEDVTRREAKNFSYGIRLLPPERRGALSAVYAVARAIDDIGDGDLPAQRKLDELAAMRARLHDLDAHRDDPALRALAHAAAVRPIPLDAFDELIDGCEADVHGRSYASYDELVWYCRCVAGSIGRLSLGVFGADDMHAAAPLADALGVALQLTNILRDLREDRANGRVYVPTEELAQSGCTLELDAEGRFRDDPERLADLVVRVGWHAQQWYDVGLRLLPHLDRRSAACCGAMAGIYHRLLGRLVEHPQTTVARRVSLTGWEKAGVATRALVGAA